MTIQTQERKFLCERCHKGYPSAQALGGHRKKCNGQAAVNGHEPEVAPSVPVLPVDKPGQKHPKSVLWLVKKDPTILAAPLLGFCIGGVLTLFVPLWAGAALGFMGFFMGLLAIFVWWANQIKPVEVYRVIAVKDHAGVEIKKTVRWREHWAKTDAEALGDSALYGGTRYIDAQEVDADGNEIQVVFNPHARQAPPYLAPQYIRFVVAHEPTRIKYKTSLFSLSKEAITTGAALIFIVIQLFVIVWAVGQLQAEEK